MCPTSVTVLLTLSSDSTHRSHASPFICASRRRHYFLLSVCALSFRCTGRDGLPSNLQRSLPTSCSSRARPTWGNGYGVSYGVVIVPLALTVIWTGGSGLVAGAWGLVPSALKIAPCAGQLNCPVDALYLTGTPACVQACSTATKLPLLIWTSQLA